MPELTAVYVDFADLACYRAWRWLSLLPGRERVEVRPFWADSQGGSRGSPWESRPSWALELLALGECAREGGTGAHHRFVEAAFTAVHARGEEGGPETWLRLGTELGLDLDRYTAEGDRWRAEVGLWHREAQDELGVRRVPALVFDDRLALSIVLADDIDDPDVAQRLLSGLLDLLTRPVAEIHRRR